ncbi:katanin p80 WD40 repeat-containing subunit B1 [Caerostris extrusa]|uniref:Katanin p80 WD40 repeat-containing subunit B1 n=1 Tax=Caerostris extrusa TaxID=172846 RepID=A0AAV4YDN1_CAEEX|nr:katanin p80 WD40 repeat-containing subunit B1 [Caerostris extrusa]
MTMTSTQLVAGSYSMNSVSVHVVQLDSLKPISKIDSSNNVSYIPNQCINPIPGAHLRKSFVKGSENQKFNSLDMKVVESVNQDFDLENDNFNFEDEIESEKGFLPKSELSRPHPRVILSQYLWMFLNL